jgi:hypothetical protein
MKFTVFRESAADKGDKLTQYGGRDGNPLQPARRDWKRKVRQ